jgi:hypothetical protein
VPLDTRPRCTLCRRRHRHEDEWYSTERKEMEARMSDGKVRARTHVDAAYELTHIGSLLSNLQEEFVF